MEIRLPSNSGRHLAKWIVTEQAEGYLCCDFEFRSQSGEETQPGTVIQFEHLILNRDELAEFVRKADAWLEQLMCESASQDFAAIVDMGGGFDNSLQLYLGRNAAAVSARNSAATFNYCVAGVSGEFVYVIDQTCLRILVEGINSVLSR